MLPYFMNIEEDRGEKYHLPSAYIDDFYEIDQHGLG